MRFKNYSIRLRWTFRRLELCISGMMLLVFVTQFGWVSLRVHTIDVPSVAFLDRTLALNLSSTSAFIRNSDYVTEQNLTTGVRFHGTSQAQRWDPTKVMGGRTADIKVGLPVFVASLPKSGTTSMFQYFTCGGFSASHQWIKTNDSEYERSGLCMMRNKARNRPIFDGCGGYDVYTDTGFVAIDKKDLSAHCYYPSIDALDAIYSDYPNATIILVVRDSTQWYESMSKWAGGSLLKRWRRCNTTGFPGWNIRRKRMKRFYNWHTDRIRRFSKSHPSMTYIEVKLESNTTAQILDRDVGIPAQCWGKCSPNSKFCQQAA